MNNTTLIAAILLIIVVGAGAFYAATKYHQTKQSSGIRQFGNFQGQRGSQQGQGNRNGFRPVSGEILSSDASGITVKLQDGSSKNILVSDKTTINKASQATKDDLKTGEKVAVFGSENADGSISAQKQEKKGAPVKYK